MKTPSWFKKTLNTVLLFGVLGLSSLPAQAVLSLADNPLFVTVALPPNVVMTLDDSGSMGAAFVPDSLVTGPNNAFNTRRFAAFEVNALYYNPGVRYVIPTRADGVTYTTSFAAAKNNGFNNNPNPAVVNLSNAYRVTAIYLNHLANNTANSENPSPDFNNANRNTGQRAYYYVRDNTLANCDGTKLDVDCFRKIDVDSTSGPNGVVGPGGVRQGIDINGDGAVTAADRDEQQNFANWYSFYRTRALTTISGAMAAIEGVSDNQIRFAWQSLNSTNSTSCDSFIGGNGLDADKYCRGFAEPSGTRVAYDNRIRGLDAAHRTRFYNFLQRFSSAGGTPIRSAYQRVGQYFSTSTGTNNPYAEFPQVSIGTELSCRKNYSVTMTDGVWNTDDITVYGNADSTATVLPDGFSFPASRAPYADNNSDSLADIAFNFWRTDLRPDLTNNVPANIIDRSGNANEQFLNARNDPATWQHVVNFNVGLGLTNSLVDPVWGGSTYAGDYALLAAGTKSWPATGAASNPTLAETPARVYDLWHAALNSRGQFFSAERPEDISNAFKTIINTIADATPSAAALAANSTSIQTGTLVYQAKFDPSAWSGNLVALPVQGDGSIGGEIWDAAKQIPAPSARKIFTISSGTGKAFTSCTASLSAAQKLALDTNAIGMLDSKCTDRLDWIRGVTDKEVRFAPGGIFRNRAIFQPPTVPAKTNVLGDIINSDPAFTQNEDFGFGGMPVGTPGQSSYASFVTSKATTPVLFVGANDGMLHAFRADLDTSVGGTELFAFIPNGVYSNLSKLTDPAYTHKFFVDGPPSVSDAFIGGAWKTVLVGGLGAGGKSIYALDVSAPSAFSASNVMWEFSDALDLGNTFSQPLIARTNDPLYPWVAIFGNGYNSTSDKAFLYIVNLQTGVLVKKIAAGTATANGLSTPVLYDSNGDKAVDAVYAGDLQGNLWKFDLSGTTIASWGVAFAGNPLFTARNASSEVQPITAQPQIGSNPNGGVLVYFGTGQYLTSSDTANTQAQNFYAIWDNGTRVLNRSVLQQQTITAQFSATFTNTNVIPNTSVTEFVRETSASTVDYPGGQRGWYLDLLAPSATGGERVVSRALLVADRVIFVTLEPSSDRCSSGGTSFLMELNAISGSRFSSSIFDFNNDGSFDAGDTNGGPPKSGVRLSIGISKTPVYLNTRDGSNDGKDTKVFSGTSGGTTTVDQPCTFCTTGVPGPAPRVFWRQIQ